MNIYQIGNFLKNFNKKKVCNKKKFNFALPKSPDGEIGRHATLRG